MKEPKQKPFSISKWEVMEAWRQVKANQGAPGVDGQSIEKFERNLKNNLYTLWNRLSSGSYFPPPVRMVNIPKPGGGERTLGIPTVADRIAQMVAKRCMEPDLEPQFHPDSYGYRPGKSAHDALGATRQRCWWYNWVCDLDIRGFFDNIPHDLLMRAVRKHAREKWVVLYIERWLKAPSQDEQGNLIERTKGTPQGGVISPLLANLYLHYAFDRWMDSHHPGMPFERFADDIIVHGRSLAEMQRVKEAIAQRLAECGLELHPEKTKIVYCKDSDRRGTHEHEKFTFLGYEFRPRLAKSRWGKHFVSFLPAISTKATRAIRDEIRTWKLHLRSDKTLEDLSRMFNPVVRGWLQYYGKYYRSLLHRVFDPLESALVRWACRKYKKLKRHRRRSRHWLRRIALREPKLFAHWEIATWRKVSSMGAV